jgi:putative FmdB family regulatory protein
LDIEEDGSMPAYEYACNDCSKEFTVFLSLKEYEEKPKIKCPHCQSDNVRKKFVGFYAKTSKKS